MQKSHHGQVPAANVRWLPNSHFFCCITISQPTITAAHLNKFVISHILEHSTLICLGTGLRIQGTVSPTFREPSQMAIMEYIQGQMLMAYHSIQDVPLSPNCKVVDELPLSLYNGFCAVPAHVSTPVTHSVNAILRCDIHSLLASKRLQKVRTCFWKSFISAIM